MPNTPAPDVPDEPVVEVAETLNETPEVVAATTSYLAGVAAEYSRYRTTRGLQWNGVPAFAAGAPFPASHPGLAEWFADGSVVEV